MSYADVDPRQSAILVMDMANDFILPGGTIADAGGEEYQERAQALLPRLQRLLEAARQAGILVIYATDAHTPDDAELAKWPPHSMKGTPEAEIADAVAPREGDLVIEKRTYSPFMDPHLERELEARGIRRLYVTGLHTDCCARHTSGDAFQRGYELVWVSDALQAFTQKAHEEGLEYFKTWYATDAERQLLTVDEVVRQWSEAGAPSTP